MFTGLVQAVGTIKAVAEEGNGRRLRMEWPALDEPLALGESVAVNGCCLTVVAVDGVCFDVQAGPETLARTNLGSLIAGNRVNLERALRPTDRLGGHFVQGHIDTTATLVESRADGEWRFLRFQVEPEWTRLMVEKGSIAVDGVSLTLVTVGPGDFSVMLIPHTLEATTFGGLKVRARVNIEADLIAKHVHRLMSSQNGVQG